MRTERTLNILHEPAKLERNRCRSTIVLDGVGYRCWRVHHTGAHDALVKHSDCGLVRW